MMTMVVAKKAKALTDKQKVKLLVDLVMKLRKDRYHFPNSDFYEYCNGCHRSPNNRPPHDENCLVVEVYNVLKKIGAFPEPKR